MMRPMRNSFVSFVALSVIGVMGLVAQMAKTPPDTLTFQAKMGKVTFKHAAHATRVKSDCKVCHPALFQQSATAPLNYKAGMHKPAETAKTACGSCHRPGGTAFESKGNCTNKCHVKG